MNDQLVIEEIESGRGRRRRCIASRQPADASGMIRFVIGPDRTLVADLAERLPGRGLWVAADRAAVARAVRGNLFAKAARSQVLAAGDLPERLEAMLAARCKEALGLARRAGELVAGFDQVADWLLHGRAALVLVARDAAPDGRRKMAALAGAIPFVQVLDRQELGAALGRDELVHVALAKGSLACRLERELTRLAGFRSIMETAENGGTSHLKRAHPGHE